MRRKRPPSMLWCALPFVPVLWLAVPVFYAGIWWMKVNDLPRRERVCGS